jgi:hypothetical protein
MGIALQYQSHILLQILRFTDGLHHAGRSTLKAKLARSGHAAYVVAEKVVITGGILRDGSLVVDVVIVDMATMSVIR